MTLPVVLVAASEFWKAEAVFNAAPDVRCVAAPGDEAVLAEAVREFGARHVIVGSAPYGGVLYQVLPRGSVIARFGQGYDNLDLRQATDAGLLCTNTPGVLHDSVAELTMALLLTAARHVASFDRELHDRQWRPRMATELRGKVIAVLGCGRIGRTVARIAAAGFGMRVVGWSRAGSKNAAALVDFADVTADLSAAIRSADFVTLHLPATPETTHLINPERLSWFLPHAWLINTARGAVVDEIALYDALVDGRLGGAALDVFAREPYVLVDPARDLRTLENVILTPHVGSSTIDASRRMAEAALHNIALAEAGNFGAMNLLNPEVLTRGDTQPN